MGAHYQPMGHAQIVTNLVDYHMDVQAAIDCAARSFSLASTTVVERGLPAATLEGLAARGHDARACTLAMGRRLRRSASTGNAAS